VRLLVDTHHGATLIPSSTIQHNGQTAFVYVLQDNVAHMRVIQPVVTDGEPPKSPASLPATCSPAAVLTSCRTTPKLLFPPNPFRETTPGALLLESVSPFHPQACRNRAADGRDSPRWHRLLHPIAGFRPAASRLSPPFKCSLFIQVPVHTSSQPRSLPHSNASSDSCRASAR